MTTLKALDGQVQMISGEGDLFYYKAERFVEELKKYSTASSHYTVISIIGPQSSGKSYMLNTLFGTKFEVLNAAGGRRQTTEGIWIARCVNPCMIIMDVEGTDGRERDNTLFETRSALFSLTLSDVLLLNMWFQDTSRVQGANLRLIELIFKQRVKIEARKTTIIILVRDYDYETPPDITNRDLNKYLNELWENVHPAPTDRKMSDYIEVIVKDIPPKILEQKFSQKSKELAEFLCSFAANERLEKKHGASGFAQSSKLIWEHICSNQRLSVTGHKLEMSAYLCNDIKIEIFRSIKKDEKYLCLMDGTSITSVKDFNTKLRSFLEGISDRYEKECRAWDRNKRKEVGDKLEEEILQEFEEKFKSQIDRLYKEKLESAKDKVHSQLLKLAVGDGDHSSVIGVTRPYLQEFNDNLPSDVLPYFKKVFNKRCKEFEAELTRIAEEEKNKIAEEQNKKMQMELSIYKIKDDILCSFDPEGYDSLTVKEFNIKLPLILEGILARYDEKTRQFDENIKGNFRDSLQEHILQRFKPIFEAKLSRLSNEILTSAKSKVRHKLRKLPVLDKDSAIGVLRPYLQKFDDNSCADVHPNFRKVLEKHREQLVKDLTNIGEEKGSKILIALRVAGASVACVELIIGTVWAIHTGDIGGASMLFNNAIGHMSQAAMGS